jgi:hypothetical protein
VRDIIKSGWIDQKTRLVVIDIIAYSPQTDLFADITISFEYLPGGLLQSSRSVQTMLLDRLSSSHPCVLADATRFFANRESQKWIDATHLQIVMPKNPESHIHLCIDATRLQIVIP